MSETTYIVAIIILFFVLLIAAAFGIYSYINYNKAAPNAGCTTDYNCSPTQYCATGGVCQEVICTLSSDCPYPETQECAYQFCYQSYCSSSSDCGAEGTGYACVDNLCVPMPTNTCTSDLDCWAGSLTCSNGVCIQCAENSDCTNGLCSNGICYTQCVSSNETNTCGPDFSCVGNACCPTSSSTPTSCNDGSTCNTSQYCVNGVCRCAPGNIGEQCGINTDCLSQNCMGGICVNSGAVCNGNYDPNDSTNSSLCSSSSPFCVNGKCSTQSIGAPCSCTFSDGNSCTQYNSCIYSVDDDPTRGYTGTIAFCLKPTATSSSGICQELPGWYGAFCFSSDGCSAITSSPNCTNNICV